MIGAVAPAPAEAPRLFCPPDVASSRERFKTSCGHAAIAALVGWSVADVWHVQPKPYTSPSAAEKALVTIGVSPRKLRPKKKDGASPWPRRGLVIVQIAGSWLEPGVPIGAAYKRMHAIATLRDMRGNWWVYDHNLEAKDIASPHQGVLGAEGGGWLLGTLWKEHVMQVLVDETRGATGWWARVTLEVLVPARPAEVERG